MATMQPITAPHEVWMRLDGKGILAEAPDDKDSHQLLAKKGDHISVRAQLLYGLTIEDGRLWLVCCTVLWHNHHNKNSKPCGAWLFWPSLP